METEETEQHAPSQPNFEQPLQYSLSLRMCHVFPRDVLEAHGAGDQLRPGSHRRTPVCPGGSAAGASTAPVVLGREGQVTSLVTGKFSWKQIKNELGTTLFQLPYSKGSPIASESHLHQPIWDDDRSNAPWALPGKPPKGALPPPSYQPLPQPLLGCQPAPQPVSAASLIPADSDAAAALPPASAAMDG